MKTHITQLFKFLKASNWCQNVWYKDSLNQRTLNADDAVKYDITGAIGYLFQGKTASAVKRHLEEVLLLGQSKYLAHLYNARKKQEDGSLEPLARTDFSNLNAFNDEVPFNKVSMFLFEASEKAN